MNHRRTIYHLFATIWSLTLVNCGKIYNGDNWIDVDYQQFQTKAPISTSFKDPSTEIFVSVASFRDARCALTLKNIFTKAKNPKRIRVGVINQIHTEEDQVDCIEDSRGPGYARHLGSYLINDEEFCLQIDAHTDFTKDWDIEMTNMWGSINNEYAILSTVPPNIDELSENKDEVPHLCEAFFDKENMIRLLPAMKVKDFTVPILSNLWSSSFSFSKCHAETKTPYDPNFQFFTSGDDFSKYARLWTRGYDVYTPNRNLVAHDSQNTMFSTIAAANKGLKKDDINTQEWVDNGMTDLYRDDTKENAKNRMDVLFGHKEVTADSISILTHYGLGLKRSLDQFIQFTGIETRSKIVFGDRCKQLKWVPYTFDRDPIFTENDVWGDGPETKFAGDSSIPLVSGKVDVFESTDTIITSNKNQNDASAEQSNDKIQYFIFGIVDYVLNRISSLIDSSIGFGHSYHIIKLILLAVPVILVVVVLALHTILDENRTDKSVKRF